MCAWWVCILYTSSYGGDENHDIDPPEHTESSGELEYLVQLVTSSEEEDKQELSKLLHIAKTSSTQTTHQSSSSTHAASPTKTIDIESVKAIKRQHKDIQKWSEKKHQSNNRDYLNSKMSPEEFSLKKKAKNKPFIPRNIEVIDVDADVKPSPEELKLKKKKAKMAEKKASSQTWER